MCKKDRQLINRNLIDELLHIECSQGGLKSPNLSKSLLSCLANRDVPYNRIVEDNRSRWRSRNNLLGYAANRSFIRLNGRSITQNDNHAAPSAKQAFCGKA